MKIDYIPILQNFLDLNYKGDFYKLENDSTNAVFHLYVLPNWNYVSKLLYITIKILPSISSNDIFLENEKLMSYIENPKSCENFIFLHSFEDKYYSISFSESFYETGKADNF